MYGIENLYKANSVRDAISAIQENPGAKFMAGGTDVLIKVKEGKLASCVLVDICDISELSVIYIDKDAIHIGPLATFSQVATDPIVLKHVPILAEAALTFGGPQLRNMGTIGGNIANGATSADIIPSLLTLNAELKLESSKGVRLLQLSEFYISSGKTVLAQDELIVDISIRTSDYEGYFGHYLKYSRRMALDIATLNCACLCRFTPDLGSVAGLRLAFGVAGPIPMRAYKTEQAVTGLPIREAFDAVGQLSAEEVKPRTSARASREFRLSLARELSRRTLEKAILNAGGTLNI